MDWLMPKFIKSIIWNLLFTFNSIKYRNSKLPCFMIYYIIYNLIINLITHLVRLGFMNYFMLFSSFFLATQINPIWFLKKNTHDYKPLYFSFPLVHRRLFLFSFPCPFSFFLSSFSIPFSTTFFMTFLLYAKSSKAQYQYTIVVCILFLYTYFEKPKLSFEEEDMFSWWTSAIATRYFRESS